jgi:hypothetical protein
MIKVLSLLLLMISPLYGREDVSKSCSMADCKHKMLSDNVLWRSYYDDADTVPGKVEMFRFKGVDNAYQCALYLEGCVTGCSCATTALLVNTAIGTWAVECEANLQTLSTGAEQRSVGGSTDDTANTNIMTADGAVSGDAVPKTLGDLLADIVSSINHTPAVTAANTQSSSSSSSSGSNDDGLEQLEREWSFLTKTMEELENPEGKSLESDAQSPDVSATTSTTTTTTTTTTQASTPKAQDTTAKATIAKDVVDINTLTSTTKSPSTTAKVDKTTTAVNADGTTAKQQDVLKEDVDELGSLQTKYYVVVAFVIIFVLILVIIAAVLFVKMKKTRAGHAIISPGPTDREPLTPSGTQTEGAFKFGSTT